MTSNEQDRINQLDRDWDANQDGDTRNNIIEQLHRADNAPGPSDTFRKRLENELRDSHPVVAGISASLTVTGSDEMESTPRQSIDRDRPLTRPSTLRQWGELAAIVLILSLAIAGSALYGADAFDFAQQQIASDTDDAEPVDNELRATLLEEGEVSGLSFEEAQSLTPMELVLPDNHPEALSEPELTVFANALPTRKPDFVWPHWRAEASYEVAGDLPPVEIGFAPAWSPGSHGMSLPTDVGRHQDAPSGTFDVIPLSNSHVLRSIELTDDGDAISHFAWHQGDVAMTLTAPVWTDLDDEQSAWIDMPETPFTYDDVEAMIESLLEHGQLDDGSDHIATRDLTMGEVLDWTPTAPFPESVPEPLQLQRADANANGPTLYMEHPDDSVHDVWLHSFVGLSATMPGGSVRADVTEALSTEQIDAGGVSVTRMAFSDPSVPDLAEFLLMTRNTDLVFPWLSGGSETALMLYLWEIAGMSFVMGVEVDPDMVDPDDGGTGAAISDLPEEDWLDLIREQGVVADETLDPEALFPELARAPTEEEEQLLTDTDGRAPVPDQIETVRLLGEQDNISFFVGVTGNQGICAITAITREDGESMGSSGCNPIWHAADVGTGTHSSGADQPAILAYVLPQGYDEVVDADGEVIGQVENQHFAMVFESGDERPSDMIARGPTGELYLDLGTSGRTQRDDPPMLDLP